MPEPIRYPAIDLLPGDQYIHPTADGVEHVVTILEQLPTQEDRFGRPTLTYRASSDGREGLVFLGERASVRALTEKVATDG